VGDLTWVKASYDSIQGKIVSEWRRDGQTLSLHVSIPANTSATIVIPSGDETAVVKNGKIVEQADGGQVIGRDGAVAAYAVGSGDYNFTTTLPLNPKRLPEK